MTKEALGSGVVLVLLAAAGSFVVGLIGLLWGLVIIWALPETTDTIITFWKWMYPTLFLFFAALRILERLWGTND